MSRPRPTAGGTDRIDRFLAFGANGLGGINANVDIAGADDAVYVETGGGVEDEWTDTAHKYLTGLLVTFTAKGTGATGYTTGVNYYVIRVDANTFQLASSLANALAGTQIEGTGDSGGTWTVTVSATQTFRAGPPAGEVWEIMRMMIRLEDGAAQFNADNYGAESALTNGVQIQIGQADGTVLHYLTGEAEDGTAQHSIKSNMDWFGAHYDMAEATFGSGNDAIVGRWSFFKGEKDGRGLILDGDRGDEFQVVINDDLSGLVEHEFHIEGTKIR